MSDDRFDPRFDPAFQRGYDGPAPATSSASASASAKPVASRAELISPPPSVAASEPARDAFPFEAVDVRSDVRGSDLDLDDAPRRVNPFLVVLAVLSLLLIGGGLYLVSRVRDLFAETQSSSDFDFVTLQVLMDAAPLIVCLGLAIAVGILFIFAVRWGRERD